MRLGALHKIDRCANRCSLYPSPAAVAYVARQRDPMFVNAAWSIAQNQATQKGGSTIKVLYKMKFEAPQKINGYNLIYFTLSSLFIAF